MTQLQVMHWMASFIGNDDPIKAVANGHLYFNVNKSEVSDELLLELESQGISADDDGTLIYWVGGLEGEEFCD